jgi:FixJ family two-component response regulator
LQESAALASTRAEDFLIKPIASNVLFAAIERAIARHDASRKVQSEFKLLLALVATLTPRERQVYDLVVRGKMNKRIALEARPRDRAPNRRATPEQGKEPIRSDFLS